jgi:hypothetical protein
MIANQTIDAPVFRGDGLQVYGLDAELERKAQAKRDATFERELLKWLEEVTGMNCLGHQCPLSLSTISLVIASKCHNKTSSSHHHQN